MRTLVFSILICWKWLGTNHRQVWWLKCYSFVYCYGRKLSIKITLVVCDWCKPFPAYQPVKYECFRCVFQVFHILCRWCIFVYRQTSNVRRTLSGYEIVDHSDVVGASPVGDSITKSSISTLTPGFKDNCMTRWETFEIWDLVPRILEVSRYFLILLTWESGGMVMLTIDCNGSCQNDNFLFKFAPAWWHFHFGVMPQVTKQDSVCAENDKCTEYMIALHSLKPQ